MKVQNERKEEGPEKAALEDPSAAADDGGAGVQMLTHVVSPQSDKVS